MPSTKERNEMLAMAARSQRYLSGSQNAISLRSSSYRLKSRESSSESDDSEDESSSDSEESVVEETVDLKVSIAQNGEVRGFSVPISRGFAAVMKQLESNYGSRPKLSYYDADGDKVSVLASSDFEYAVRSHKSMTSLEKKSKKMGANKLTFTADFILQDLKAKAESTRLIKSSLSSDKCLQKAASTSSIIDRTDSGTYGCSDSSPSDIKKGKDRPESSEVMWQRGELLGAGSFGQVYSGIDMSTGLRIAVKEVMLGTGKRHEQQAMALLREIKILSALDHPNIIKYLGTEYSHHTMRIFLELATEGSIKDALTAFGALAEPIIRKYALDIVSGLAFLHSKRFIHRDIKPTNLLISNGVIKVADFGCSSSSFDPVGGFATSEMGHATVTGTTVYMAPEVMGVEDEGADHSGDHSFNSKSIHRSVAKNYRWEKSRRCNNTVNNSHNASINNSNDGNEKICCDNEDHGDGSIERRTEVQVKPNALFLTILPSSTDDDVSQVDDNHRVSALEIGSVLGSGSGSGKGTYLGDSKASTALVYVANPYCVIHPDDLMGDMHHMDGGRDRDGDSKEGSESPIQASSPLREKRNGYGRKADIWSFGVTLAEMSTGKSPYRTAAAAIYNVCVSKKYPSFAPTMSPDAQHFLGRCLVAEPRLRASCEELMAHPFLSPQTIAELRLQGKVHTVSTVSFTPLESLRQDFVIDREQRDMVKTPLYVSSCTSVECNTKNSSGSDSERDSKYSSVGSPDSWLREESSASKARGRREGGREYREASKWEESGRPNFCPDIFCDSGAKVYPENVPKGRPPRAGHK